MIDSSLLYNIGMSARHFVQNRKLPHFVTFTTVSMALSFLCFTVGGRIDVAIGGLLGQSISCTVINSKYCK